MAALQTKPIAGPLANFEICEQAEDAAARERSGRFAVRKLSDGHGSMLTLASWLTCETLQVGQPPLLEASVWSYSLRQRLRRENSAPPGRKHHEDRACQPSRVRKIVDGSGGRRPRLSGVIAAPQTGGSTPQAIEHRSCETARRGAATFNGKVRGGADKAGRTRQP
jgi:hypothetical protein